MIEVPSDIKQAFQSQLERVGVPVNTSTRATNILAKEYDNPGYQRTPEEQKDIDDAYTWFVAKLRSGSNA